MKGVAYSSARIVGFVVLWVAVPYHELIPMHPRLAQFTSVIAMDLRGFGASAKPDWPARSAYSAEAQARNVLALLDQLQLETVLLVGYDIGSRVAQTVAQLAPGRATS